MAVLLYEGWDMHEEGVGSGIHPLGVLDWDGYPDWDHGGGGINRNFDYGAGYSGGQALHNYRQSSRGSLRVNFTVNTEVRVSWFGKPGNTSTTVHNMLSLMHSSGEHVYLRSVDVNTIGLYDNAGAAVTGSTFTMEEDWAHYEFYLNASTGAYLVRKDGTSVLSGTMTMASANGFTQFHIYANVTNNSWWWDHIIITDGNSLRDLTGYHAVGVTWQGFGKATTANTGIRARITKDGNTEYGTTFEMDLATVDHYSPRYSNVYTEFWMTNPWTAAAWGLDLVAAIDSWGLCRTDSVGGWLVVPSAFLSFIVINTDGEPLVQYQAPDDTLVADPTWVKTHAEYDYHLHVDNYPRKQPSWDEAKIAFDPSSSGGNPNPFDATASGDPDSVDWSAYTYEEFWFEDFIGCTGPGCITFTLPDTFELETTYGGTGLAFAEEYRTTYKDWQTIIDGGDDFCSYFISGYKLHGDASKKFQSNYLTVNYETDVLGSAFIQGVWDYALANTPGDAHSRSDTGRWGQTQQIYGVRNDEDYKHAFAKLKIRGHGRAMQLKVKCESGKPFWLNGWSMFVTGNTTQ